MTWPRLILTGLGLFLAGGVLSFAYSYRPLHGSLNFKVEQLESRLDERNLELMRLRDEVKALRSSNADRIDPDTLAQVERELEKTQLALADAEKKHDRAEQKRKDANASAARWRKRYESLQTAQRTAAPKPPAAPSPRVSPVESGDPAAVPATATVPAAASPAPFDAPDRGDAGAPRRNPPPIQPSAPGSPGMQPHAIGPRSGASTTPSADSLPAAPPSAGDADMLP